MRKLMIGLMSVLVTAVMLMSLGSTMASDYAPTTVVVPYTDKDPTIDGNISAGEYANSAYMNFEVTGICGLDDGEVSIYAQHNGENMFIGIDVAFDDTYNDSMFDDYLTVIFDMDSDGEIDFREDAGSNPFDDAGFWMPSDQFDEITGDITIGGRAGFARTNLSSDKHTIFEIAVADLSLPAPGDYFGIWMVGEQQYCTVGDEDYSGWAYPDDVIADNNVYTDYDNWTVDHFAQWTLQAPFLPSKTTVDYLPIFMFYFLIGVAVVTTFLLATKDEELQHRPYNLYCAVIIAIAVVGVIYIYLYMNVI